MPFLRLALVALPFASFATLGACSSSPPSSTPPDGPRPASSSEPPSATTSAPLLPKRWAPATELLLPLVKACASVPDAFVDGDGRCACPPADGGSLRVFTTRGSTPVCAAAKRMPSHLASCLAEDGAAPRLSTDADRSRWNGCLQELAQLDDDAGYTAFGLSLPDVAASGTLASDAVRWAQARFAAPGSASVSLWSEGLASDSWKLHVGRPPASELAEAVRDLLAPVFAGNGLPWMFRSHAFGFDVTAFDALVGDPIAELGRLRALTPPPPGSDATATALYLAYTAVYYDGALDLTPTRGREFGPAGRGCAGHCTVESDDVALTGELTVRRERVYLWGTIARDVLWVARAGRRLGAVVVGPATVPLAYLAFDAQADRTSLRLTVRAFDHRWNGAGSVPFETSVPFEERAAAARFAPGADAAPTVILCEGQGKELLHAPDLAPHVLVGPLASEAPEGAGSFFGWVPNPSGDPTRGLLGVADDALGAVPLRPGFYIEAGHAEATARAALSVEPSARFVPIGTDACFSRFDDWAAPLTTCSGAPCSTPASRVVSMSFGWTGLSNACTTSFGALFGETKERVLWVAAAGNGGVGLGRSGTEVPAGFCPAVQGGTAPNLLVVAAGSEQGLAPYSNFGVTKVDLAAAGESTGNGLPFEGTSFATPRVAAVAARILRDAPSLSPSDARIILMAAATPAASLRSSVRSGGLLDPSVSLQTATCIASSGASLARAGLAACLRSAGYAGDIEDKLTLLANRGTPL